MPNDKNEAISDDVKSFTNARTSKQTLSISSHKINHSNRRSKRIAESAAKKFMPLTISKELKQSKSENNCGPANANDDRNVESVSTNNSSEAKIRTESKTVIVSALDNQVTIETPGKSSDLPKS